MEVRWFDEIPTDPGFRIGEPIVVTDSDDVDTTYYYDGWDAETLRVRLVK